MYGRDDDDDDDNYKKGGREEYYDTLVSGYSKLMNSLVRFTSPIAVTSKMEFYVFCP